VTVEHYVCLRCGYQWLPKLVGYLPKYCPSCGSSLWHKPRKPNIDHRKFMWDDKRKKAKREAMIKIFGKNLIIKKGLLKKNKKR